MQTLSQQLKVKDLSVNRVASLDVSTLAGQAQAGSLPELLCWSLAQVWLGPATIFPGSGYRPEAAPRGPLDMDPLLGTVRKKVKTYGHKIYYASWLQSQRMVMGIVNLIIKICAIVTPVIYHKGLRDLFLKHGFLFQKFSVKGEYSMT